MGQVETLKIYGQNSNDVTIDKELEREGSVKYQSFEVKYFSRDNENFSIQNFGNQNKACFKCHLLSKVCSEVNILTSIN